MILRLVEGIILPLVLRVWSTKHVRYVRDAKNRGSHLAPQGNFWPQYPYLSFNMTYNILTYLPILIYLEVTSSTRWHFWLRAVICFAFGRRNRFVTRVKLLWFADIFKVFCRRNLFVFSCYFVSFFKFFESNVISEITYLTVAFARSPGINTFMSFLFAA